MNETQALKRLLTDKLGFVERKLWDKDIELGLKAISSKYDTPPGKLLQRMLGDDALLKELAEHLTVGETYFFRHPEHFKLMVEHLRNQPSAAPFTIVSLGCASGEEAYSVAISLVDAFSPMMPPRCSIIGLEMNEALCQKAQKGEYLPWSFRTTSPHAIARYFEPLGKGKSRVRADIKRLVSFEHKTIEQWLASRSDRTVDIIFFRNVAIYLTPQKVESLLGNMARVLKLRGLLMLAPADPMPQESRFQRYGKHETSVFTLSATSTGKRHPVISASGPTGEAKPFSFGSPHKTPTRPPPNRLSAPAENTGVDRPPPANAPSAMTDPDGVIHQLSEWLLRNPTDAQAYHLRGQAHLAFPHYDLAIEDFRRVLFLAPEHKLGRYWYALALACSELFSNSAKQVEELSRQLASLAPDQLLEDGATSVRELKEAITAIEEVR